MASDIISATDVEEIGVDVRVKFGYFVKPFFRYTTDSIRDRQQPKEIMTRGTLPIYANEVQSIGGNKLSVN